MFFKKSQPTIVVWQLEHYEWAKDDIVFLPKFGVFCQPHSFPKWQCRCTQTKTQRGKEKIVITKLKKLKYLYPILTPLYHLLILL